MCACVYGREEGGGGEMGRRGEWKGMTVDVLKPPDGNSIAGHRRLHQDGRLVA